MRTLFLMLLLLGAAALACNLVESSVTPTPFAATAPTATATIAAAPASASATPRATVVPSATTTAGFTTYSDEDLGLTFRYPAAWTLDANAGFITVVSSGDLLTADRLDQEGAGMLITAGPDDRLISGTVSLEEALVTAIDQLGFAEEQEIVEGPETTTINGQDAALATVVGRDDAGNLSTLFYVTLIHAEGRAALAAGVTRAEEAGGEVVTDSPFRQTLETIATSIALSRPAGPVVEGNLAYGESGQGTVPEDESSAWTFAATAGEVVDITVEPLDPDLDVTVDVLDGNGDSVLPEGTVDEAFGTETIDRLALEEDGEYTILLQGFAGSAGDYRVTLNEVTATATGEAVVLSLDNTISAEVGTDEVDTYLLTDVISRPVTILVDPDPDFDVVVDLYGPGGGLLDSSDNGFAGQSERLSFTPLGGNVQVRGYAGAAGRYTITLLSGSAEAAGTTLVASNTLQGEEEQAYPFFTTGSQLVTAYVEPEEALDVVVEVWQDDDETLLETVDLSYGAEQVDFSPPEPGNYSFTVYGFEGATGSYTMTIQGTAATIFELAPGDEVAGRLAEGSTLEYLFRLEPGAALTFTAQGEEETDLTLAVEDLDGNVLATADDSSAGGLEILAFTAPPGSGDDPFLLRVEEYGGSAGAFTLLLQ